MTTAGDYKRQWASPNIGKNEIFGSRASRKAVASNRISG